jgi:hypothetical protein
MPPRTGWRGASGGCPLKTGEDHRRSRFVFDLNRLRRGKLIAQAPAILPEKADLHLSLDRGERQR